MQAHWLDRQLLPFGPETLADEGVHYEHVPVTSMRARIDEIRAQQGYVTEDEVALTTAHPKLEELMDNFAIEHRHDDDEVRYVLDGEGIFDIRTSEDRWMRVKVESGDLIIVPSGRFHRFYLTPELSIRCVRLFREVSGWVPHYRDSRDSSMSLRM